MWETLKTTEPITDSIESQDNGTDQIFNEITEENSPTLRKTCLYREKKHTGHQTDKIRTETPHGTEPQ